MNVGSVIWLTGLSGAGKSTLARAVQLELNIKGCRTELLDGDAIRAVFPCGFTRDERDLHVKHVGFLASRLAQHGVIAICALVSPYEASREWVRSLCGRFVEVYVSTPIHVCEQRDVKGLYARARRGELRHLTGIDDPYEPPRRPAIALDTTAITVEAARDAVLHVWSNAVSGAPTQTAG